MLEGTGTLDVIEQHKPEAILPDAPELMPLAVAEATFRSDEAITFDDPLVCELLATAPLRRLAGIGFLGAIDHIRHGSGRSAHRRRHNRLEHTLGVTRLADIYAREAGLCHSRRRLLLASALLHDVGHGPLSHTLEPVFAEAFGVDHHSMTRRIVRGETRDGASVRAALQAVNLDPDEVLAMIDGHHCGPDAFLFAGSINLDTLDDFFGRHSAQPSLHETTHRAAWHASRSPSLGTDRSCAAFGIRRILDAEAQCLRSTDRRRTGSPNGCGCAGLYED